jgi:hypothetical protein
MAGSTKFIPGGEAGKGTPLGDAKDIAMRLASNHAIVELVTGPKTVQAGNKNAVGKTSSETSLLQLGSPSGSLKGKTIMLARNGKLGSQPLRQETLETISAAHAAGAKFVVGDMPRVDSPYVEHLNKIGADYTVYHTGKTPRFPVNTGSSVRGGGLGAIELGGAGGLGINPFNK